MGLSVLFEHSYATELTGLYRQHTPVPVTAPKLVRFNTELAGRLGIGLAEATDIELAATFAGNVVPNDARPIAQAYAGHQFGGYSPLLGDGRAVLLGEVVAPDRQRFDIALKGSGRTPFSRRGDGRAGLGPVLREYLIGEAMHALGVPTTRALAAVTTGEPVIRQTSEPGAVLTRVAASHLRIGTLQYAAASGDPDMLHRLVDYAVDRHGPDDLGTDCSDAERALGLLQAVSERQARLIATWMHLGFIHGVMNTDNMTISGETIDYGPCAFMEAYDPAAVFSSIDRGGRYRYENQPSIGLWNLARLAEALLTLVDDNTDRAVASVTEVLDSYLGCFEMEWLRIARLKLGAPEADRSLADDFLEVLKGGAVDFTLAWRSLTDTAADPAGDESQLLALLGDGDAATAWVDRWRDAVDRRDESVATMRRANPIYIPRNHLVEEALAAANTGDLQPFERLLDVITAPFDERLEDTRCAHPAAAEFTDAYVTYCGT